MAGLSPDDNERKRRAVQLATEFDRVAFQFWPEGFAGLSRELAKEILTDNRAQNKRMREGYANQEDFDNKKAEFATEILPSLPDDNPRRMMWEALQTVRRALVELPHQFEVGLAVEEWE